MTTTAPSGSSGVGVEPRADARVDSGRAWAVAVMGMLANAVTFGILYGFGTFFDEMAAEFGAGRGATAAVFSINTFVFFSLGLFTGPLSDRIGPRRIIVAGAVCLAAGLYLTSRVQHLWLGYLTFGGGVGVGVGCFLVPVVAAVGRWFVRRRSLATGITLTGMGLGTLVVVPLIEALVDRVGWRDAFAALAAVALVTLLALALVVGQPPAPAGARPAVSVRELAADGRFRRLYGCETFLSAALFVPFVFLVSYAEDHGVAGGPASLLIGVIGASSIVGRLGLASLTGRLGAVRLLLLCFVLQPAGYLAWLASDGAYPVLVVFAVLLGVGYGGFISIAPEVATQIWGATSLGSVIGLLYTGGGVGGLIGPISAGLLIDAAGGSYTVPILAAAALTAVSLGFLWPLRSYDDLARQARG
ncbi:MAG: MFS transporter [Acidimicrobiales bacterium]